MTKGGARRHSNLVVSHLAASVAGAGLVMVMGLWAATGTPAGDPEARLRKLTELLDKGLITQEDYDRRRAEILQSL